MPYNNRNALVTRCRVLSDSGLRGFEAGSSVIQPHGEFEWNEKMRAQWRSRLPALDLRKLARRRPLQSTSSRFGML